MTRKSKDITCDGKWRVPRAVFGFLLFVVLAFAALLTRIASATELPKVRDGVGIAVVFPAHAPLRERRKILERADITWDNGQIADLYGRSFQTVYIPYARAGYSNSPADVEFFTQKHPDWLEYLCDRRSLAKQVYNFDTPEEYYLYPVDISNLEVRNYFLNTYIRPALRKGLKGIAFDNADPENDLIVVNADHQKLTAGRCGVFRGGNWHQQYSGSRVDPAFRAAYRDWLVWMRDEIHALGGVVMINVWFDANNPQIFSGPETAVADVVLTEQGQFDNLDGCSPSVFDATWLRRFNAFRAVASRQGLIMVDRVCRSIEQMRRTPVTIEWAIANYLLLRGDFTYLALFPFTNDTKIIFADIPQLKVQIGSAIEAARPLSGNLEKIGDIWTRKYTHGIVVVNTSSAVAGRISLQHGITYTDLQGKKYSAVATVAPRTALVLVKE